MCRKLLASLNGPQDKVRRRILGTVAHNRDRWMWRSRRARSASNVRTGSHRRIDPRTKEDDARSFAFHERNTGGNAEARLPCTDAKHGSRLSEWLPELVADVRASPRHREGRQVRRDVRYRNPLLLRARSRRRSTGRWWQVHPPRLQVSVQKTDVTRTFSIAASDKRVPLRVLQTPMFSGDQCQHKTAGALQ